MTGADARQWMSNDTRQNTGRPSARRRSDLCSSGRSTIAAPWKPDASLADEFGNVKSEFLWSALDCTGGFAVLPLPDGLAIVLGELCTSIAGEVACGEHCVVVGWPLAVEGRKRLAGSAVYARSGRLVAKARAVWIEVPLNTWN